MGAFAEFDASLTAKAREELARQKPSKKKNKREVILDEDSIGNFVSASPARKKNSPQKTVDLSQDGSSSEEDVLFHKQVPKKSSSSSSSSSSASNLIMVSSDEEEEARRETNNHVIAKKMTAGDLL